MQIGQAAAASGASAKMIRHYEAIGLVAPAGRRDSNYRDYSADDVARLRFVRRARDLGFSIERIRDLLALWSDRGRSSAEVKRIALDHIADLETRISALREMAATLHDLADGCAGNERPDCAIIEGLAGRSCAPASGSRADAGPGIAAPVPHRRPRRLLPEAERAPPGPVSRRSDLPVTGAERTRPTAPGSPRRTGRPSP